MAIEDWIEFGHWDDDDYFGNDPEESLPFDAKCNWCGKDIRMTPTEKGWKPMLRGKVHVCEERKEQQRKALLSLLPDLSLPECHFCGTNMIHQRVEPEPDGDEWWHHYRLVCPKCGASGPRIEPGTEKWKELNSSKV